MDKAQTLHAFFSGFNLPAYDENTVPDDATLPYLTYEVATAKMDTTVYLSASIWDRSTSWEYVSNKADEIAESLGTGGTTIPFDGGLLYIVQGSPFAQRSADDDDTIRKMDLNFTAEFFSAN